MSVFAVWVHTAYSIAGGGRQRRPLQATSTSRRKYARRWPVGLRIDARKLSVGAGIAGLQVGGKSAFASPETNVICFS
jgi:hypothetical protein